MTEMFSTIVDFFIYMFNRWDILLELAINHMLMVLIGIGLALLVGVPLGIISTKNERLGSFILTGANILQIIPSLALLALLMIFFGLGFTTVVIGLFIYSLLPIIRNTHVGIKQVDKDILEAGRGLGMNRFQLMWKIQFPLSLPFLMAGLRVAAVIAIGVATLAPLIGGDGLGREIYAGLNTGNSMRIYAAAIPACLLAILTDIILGQIEKRTKANIA